MADLLASVPQAPTRKQYDFYSLHAREKFGLPELWQWFKIEAKGDPGNPQFIVITGAVCTEVYKAGKAKGHLNWSKRDKSTELPVTISRADHKAWLASWERKTGECHHCHGNGTENYGWSQSEGSKYRTCSRCGGTGAAPKAEAA